MRKLSMNEAVGYIQQANRQVSEIPDVRFGQALYNALPKDITAEINATDVDFFYWTDESMVLDVYFNNLVSSED